MGDPLIMSKKERLRKSVFDRVSSGDITQKAASKRLGLSYRQIKRSYARYRKEGDAGLIHKNRGSVSNRKFPEGYRQKVCTLYEENYLGFGATLAAEKLTEQGYAMSAETLRRWLLSEGLLEKRRCRSPYRKQRPRRRRFGEMLQLDGSIHAWFDGVEKKQCLMNIVDDATGKTLSWLAKGETTEAAFEVLRRWIEQHGIPMSVYVDLKSVYVSPKALRDDEEEPVESSWLTQFSAVCEDLGIEVIKAYSPQAKGRVERNHAVYQDRFVKELKLKGIKDIESANQLLHGGFIDQLNDKFMKAPLCSEDAHVHVDKKALNRVFCWRYQRTLMNDWTIQFENQIYQLKKNKGSRLRPRHKIDVRRQMDGLITLHFQGNTLDYERLEKKPHQPKPEKIRSDSLRSLHAKRNKYKTPWAQFNPAWLKPKTHKTDEPLIA